jgi:hypothetical protein
VTVFFKDSGPESTEIILRKLRERLRSMTDAGLDPLTPVLQTSASIASHRDQILRVTQRPLRLSVIFFRAYAPSAITIQNQNPNSSQSNQTAKLSF